MADPVITHTTQHPSGSDSGDGKVSKNAWNEDHTVTGLSAGALTLLEQHTASNSATLDFPTAISATYDEYQIEFVNVIPVTDATTLLMRMGTGGGPTYDTGANYGWAAWIWRAGANAVTGSEGGATSISLTYTAEVSNSANLGINGSIRLFAPGGSLYKRVLGEISHLEQSTGNRMSNHAQGTYESATAVTAFRFLFSSGNIASGTIRVYGIAKA